MNHDVVSDMTPAHRNHGLFSDHYLNELLPAQPGWETLKGEAAKVLAEMRALYDARSDFLPDAPEAQLEDDFVKPALHLLGHTFAVQAALRTPDGSKRPDYVFFRDESAADALKGKPLTDESLRADGLAIGDAKAWDRSLDVSFAPVGSGPNTSQNIFSNKNPSFQIAFYLQHSGLTWGILTNGRLWRLYHRESAHKLDRYYEVDLPALLASGDVARFLYFYALFRRAAFEPIVGGEIVLASLLTESTAYARAVGSSLRDQVYRAVQHLAQGFLDFADNGLTPDAATLATIYDNSLIVLYRLLFALYAEARGLLPVRENTQYRDDYSVDAIKRAVAARLDRGRGRRPNSAQLWPQLRTLFDLIDKGDPPLQVATFNGGLFDTAKHPFLSRYSIGDAQLERALDLIARVDGQFVDYRDLATRHLGTIYEGLLEYHLEYDGAAENGFGVVLLNDNGERKSSGSFYTPDYIVEHIVRNALDPVIDATVAGLKDDVQIAEAVLRLNVLDPAMGSGHFLVEATDHLSQYLATLSIAPDSIGLPPNESADLRFWKRRVAQACIYGVDLNPLAVELAKLSMWLATAAQDRPLSFLDHHLRTGNSLVGARLATLRQAKATRTRAKRRPVIDDTQTSLMDTPAFRESMRDAVVSLGVIEANPGQTVADVKAQEHGYTQLHEGLVAKFGRALDLVAAMQLGLAVDPVLIPFALEYASGAEAPRMKQLDAYVVSAEQMRNVVGFFHWEIEFPDVFFNNVGESLGQHAGFDVVVGNPPYDVLSAKERDESAVHVQQFLAYAKRDPILSAVLGLKVDLFRLFVAQSLALGRPGATAGFIVPLSLLGDQQSASLRRMIFARHALHSVHAFPQKDDPQQRIFPEAKLPTCVVALGCHVPGDEPFRVTIHPGREFEEVAGSYVVTPATISSADPKMLTIPLHGSEAGSGLTSALWSRPGVCRMRDLFKSSQGEINETIMRDLLSTDPAHGPKVFRGGNIGRYRFDMKMGQGVDKYIDAVAYHAKARGARSADTALPRLGYQRNSALDSGRRLLFTLIPTPSYCFDSISYIPIDGVSNPFAWLALLNSDFLEWVFRLTSTNNHVSTEQVHRLPALRATTRTTKTSTRKREAMVGRAIAAVTNPKDAVGVVGDIRSMCNAPIVHIDLALDVLNALGYSRLGLETKHADAIEAFWLDLEGAITPGVTRKLSRLWTPMRARAGLSADDPRVVQHGAKVIEADAVLGKVARRIIDFDAVGMLGETQWKWLLLRKLSPVPNLSILVSLFRQHQPAIASLRASIETIEWMINQVVYAAFGLTLDDVQVVEQALARSPIHP